MRLIIIGKEGKGCCLCVGCFLSFLRMEFLLFIWMFGFLGLFFGRLLYWLSSFIRVCLMSKFFVLLWRVVFWIS